MNRAAIRKANLSAAEMLKAELAGKAKQESPSDEQTSTAASAETAAGEQMDDPPPAAVSEVDTKDNILSEDTVAAPAGTDLEGDAMVDAEPPQVAVEQDGIVDAVISTPPVVAESVEEDVPASAVNGEGIANATDGVADASADLPSSPSKGRKRTADEAGIPASRTQAAVAEAKEEEGSSSSSDDIDEEDEDDAAGDTTTASVSTAHVPKPLKMLGNNMVEQEDTVQLWEAGYKERYYEQKFGAHIEDADFRRQVATHYVEGLCWVLAYYYTGCPSWTWYYPYHFAPFASDFTGLESMDINFETGKPFRPFEQLMGVFPAASKTHLPPPFQELMTNDDSEIIDFYPDEFHVDMNGKKMLWQGVALLPFIDEKRLLGAMSKKYPELTEDENRRNAFGKDVIFVNEDHTLYDQISSLYMKRKVDSPVPLDPQASKGFTGTVLPDEGCVPNSTYINPLPSLPLSDLKNDKSISAYWWMPEQLRPHTSTLLPGYRPAKRVLTPDDIEAIKRGDNGGHGGRDRFRRGPAGDGFHAQRRDLDHNGPRRDARDVANARGGRNMGQQNRSGWGDNSRGGGDRGYASNPGGNQGGYGGRGGDERSQGRYNDRDRRGDAYGGYSNGHDSRQSGYSRPPPSQPSRPSQGYPNDRGHAPPPSYGSYGGSGYAAPPPPSTSSYPAASSYGGYGGYGGSYGGVPPSSSYGAPPPSTYSAPPAHNIPGYSPPPQTYGSYGGPPGYNPPPPSSSYGGPPPQGYNPPPPAQGYAPSYGGGGYGGYGQAAPPPAQGYYQPPPTAAGNRGAILPPHLQQQQNQHRRY